MMFKTKEAALIGVVFCISVMHVVGAFEVREAIYYSSELLSFTINQCPDRLGDACRFNYSLPLQIDIKFRATKPFERVEASFNFDNHYWLADNLRGEHERKEAFWIDNDVCQMDDSFCPGDTGDERTYHSELDLSATAELWSTPGRLTTFIVDENSSLLISAYFPIVGYS